PESEADPKRARRRQTSGHRGLQRPDRPGALRHRGDREEPPRQRVHEARSGLTGPRHPGRGGPGAGVEAGRSACLHRKTH
ncbi:hypothetical protein PEI39_12305, partial [Streptococcus pneumoniae]